MHTEPKRTEGLKSTDTKVSDTHLFKCVTTGFVFASLLWISSCTPAADGALRKNFSALEHRVSKLEKTTRKLQRRVSALHKNAHANAKWQQSVHEGLGLNHTELNLVRSLVMQLTGFKQAACTHFKKVLGTMKKRFQKKRAALTKLRKRLETARGRKKKRLRKKLQAVEKQATPLRKMTTSLQSFVKSCQRGGDPQNAPSVTQPPGGPPPSPPPPLPGAEPDEADDADPHRPALNHPASET
jgi:chaperonin cofactor prefoldin